MAVVDALLAVGLLGAAGAALLASGARRTVGAYLVFGLVLAAASLSLGAWEVAVVETVLGAGVTAGLLWWAMAGGTPDPAGSSDTRP